ncbi:MAG: NAD(P)/FAD-dependent oxidoreductase, partial [Planctomycetales bacterium]|nr:NAD(P)/FAD-dependent oxidoreductase [Planctomycetales bacterium]
LFRSIFLEGLARPFAGVRLILKHLVKKFRSLGGDLRLRSRVQRIDVDDGRATGVTLTDGTEIAADRVMSSAGWYETMRMCGEPADQQPRDPGRLSFVESFSWLDCQPQELGIDTTIVFFNQSERFHWRVPDELVDPTSGVICSPNNFAYEQPLDEGAIRVTSLANYRQWRDLDRPDYESAKRHWYDRVTAAIVGVVPDFRPHVVATDMFTPTTIERFTLHENGAVYGAPWKRYDGTTHLKNLFICGTDQGWVGIIGAIVSGISMANRHVLRST